MNFPRSREIVFVGFTEEPFSVCKFRGSVGKRFVKIDKHNIRVRVQTTHKIH